MPSTPPRSRKTLCCSFCGKSEDEVARLVAGPQVYICDECVSLCHDIVEDGGETTSSRRPKPNRLSRYAAFFAAIADKLEKNPDTPELASEARVLAQELSVAGATRS